MATVSNEPLRHKNITSYSESITMTSSSSLSHQDSINELKPEVEHTTYALLESSTSSLDDNFDEPSETHHSLHNEQHHSEEPQHISGELQQLKQEVDEVVHSVDDFLLNQVFSSVKLLNVDYVQKPQAVQPRPRTHSKAPQAVEQQRPQNPVKNQEHHEDFKNPYEEQYKPEDFLDEHSHSRKLQQNVFDDEKDQNDVIAQLDNVLEDMHSTSISVVSNSEIEPEGTLTDNEENQTMSENISDDDSNFQIGNGTNVNAHLRHPEDRGNNHYVTRVIVNDHDSKRHRTDTIDSLVSTAESRYGSFHLKNIGIGALKKHDSALNHKINQRKTTLKNNILENKFHNAIHENNNGKNEIARKISLYEEDVEISPILASILDKSSHIRQDGNITYLKPEYVEEVGLDTDSITKICIGGTEKYRASDEDKVILLFGPKNSGKTSLIMSMLNYLYDVKKEHEFRLAIEDPQHRKPTTKLVAYVFKNTIYPYQITVIDSPGIPNSHGYRKTSDQVQNWFKKELKTGGKFRLDAISVVIRDQDHLSQPLIHELNTIQELFGGDLKSNVLPVITFAEVSASFLIIFDLKVYSQTLAIQSLVNAGITFNGYYKVQNNSVEQRKKTDNALKHLLYYNHTMSSLEKFFQKITGWFGKSAEFPFSL